MQPKIIQTEIFGDGQDIIFVDGKYYMVSDNPNTLSISEDLLNWETKVFNNESKIKQIRNIAYGNGTFIITGFAGTEGKTYIMISKDGTTWTHKEISTSQSFSLGSNTCKFINNRFVFLTGYYNSNTSTGIRNYTVMQTYETRDGTTISRYDHRYDGSKNTDMMDLVYGNGLYVKIGETGTIYTSSNLKDWTARTSGVSTKLVGVSFGKGRFIVTGANGVILSSSDGIKWSRSITNTNSYLIRSRYGNGLYIACGYNSTLLSSIDGENWEKISLNSTNSIWYGMVYTNNKYVVTGNRSNATGQIVICTFDTTRDIGNSDEDCLYIYNSQLEFLGIVDTFISLRWRRKYFEAGEFEIVVELTEQNINLLSMKDNIVIRSNYTESGVIEGIHLNDDGTDVTLTITGRFMSSILSRRIIQKTINFNGSVINGMKILIDNVTPLATNFEYEQTQISSPQISFQCTYKNLYNYIVKLSKYSLIAFRVVPNIENKVFIFENYKGLDRTSSQDVNEIYSFSDDNSNIEQSEFIFDEKTEYNYALIGGAGEGSARILKSVKKGSDTGFDLREIFVDAKSQSNSDVSASEYLNILADLGYEKMTNRTYSFEATVDTRDYKTKWDLGDIVNVRKERWGIETTEVISEIEEVIEDKKKNITVTFGTPIPDPFTDDED